MLLEDVRSTGVLQAKEAGEHDPGLTSPLGAVHLAVPKWPAEWKLLWF